MSKVNVVPVGSESVERLLKDLSQSYSSTCEVDRGAGKITTISGIAAISDTKGDVSDLCAVFIGVYHGRIDDSRGAQGAVSNVHIDSGGIQCQSDPREVRSHCDKLEGVSGRERKEKGGRPFYRSLVLGRANGMVVVTNCSGCECGVVVHPVVA